MNTSGFGALSFQSCPVDLLGFQERFDFEPAEQYRRVFSRSGLYSLDILPLDTVSYTHLTLPTIA